ncbi:hypothetical protein Tco_0185794 [Tanacetum coccineum]
MFSLLLSYRGRKEEIQKPGERSMLIYKSLAEIVWKNVEEDMMRGISWNLKMMKEKKDDDWIKEVERLKIPPKVNKLTVLMGKRIHGIMGSMMAPRFVVKWMFAPFVTMLGLGGGPAWVYKVFKPLRYTYGLLGKAESGDAAVFPVGNVMGNCHGLRMGFFKVHRVRRIGFPLCQIKYRVMFNSSPLSLLTLINSARNATSDSYKRYTLYHLVFVLLLNYKERDRWGNDVYHGQLVEWETTAEESGQPEMNWDSRMHCYARLQQVECALRSLQLGMSRLMIRVRRRERLLSGGDVAQLLTSFGPGGTKDRLPKMSDALKQRAAVMGRQNIAMKRLTELLNRKACAEEWVKTLEQQSDGVADEFLQRVDVLLAGKYPQMADAMNVYRRLVHCVSGQKHCLQKHFVSGLMHEAKCLKEEIFRVHEQKSKLTSKRSKLESSLKEANSRTELIENELQTFPEEYNNNNNNNNNNNDTQSREAGYGGGIERKIKGGTRNQRQVKSKEQNTKGKKKAHNKQGEAKAATRSTKGTKQSNEYGSR